MPGMRLRSAPESSARHGSPALPCGLPVSEKGEEGPVSKRGGEAQKARWIEGGLWLGKGLNRARSVGRKAQRAPWVGVGAREARTTLDDPRPTLSGMRGLLTSCVVCACACACESIPARLPLLHPSRYKIFPL